jgi:prolycopene isomerase
MRAKKHVIIATVPLQIHHFNCGHRIERCSGPMTLNGNACRERYKKSPSFVSVHMGVREDALPQGTQCHHIIVEDWAKMEEPLGTVFVSIPTLLDPSLSPEGTQIVHVFSPDWIDNYQVRLT